jgi:chlorite dismutase
MNETTSPRVEISLRPTTGWHCTHFFYRWNRPRLEALSPAARTEGRRAFTAILDPQQAGGPTRLQTFVIMGHKADFGVLALDPDPLVVNGIHQRLLASPLGAALEAVWSFVSLTELSEYMPSAEQYGKQLVAQGQDSSSAAYGEQLASYQRRLEIMQRQRLNPDLPVWPALCFYPMNKRREGHANWFLLDFDERARLMSEHGGSGMKFAGKVTQLVSGAIGLDDWEWGVTLWARSPDFLKDIVYRMRFDVASAKYAEFGPFFLGYLHTAEQILEHCRIA